MFTTTTSVARSGNSCQALSIVDSKAVAAKFKSLLRSLCLEIDPLFKYCMKEKYNCFITSAVFNVKLPQLKMK